MRLDGALPNLTPGELNRARLVLGRMWGLGRRVSVSEMAVMLGFHRRDAYLRYEEFNGEPTGPMSAAVRAWLQTGYRPPNAPRVDHDREAFIRQIATATDTPSARVRLAVKRLEDEGLIQGPNERRRPLAAGVRRLSQP